jgi:hypothetical protein
MEFEGLTGYKFVSFEPTDVSEEHCDVYSLLGNERVTPQQ